MIPTAKDIIRIGSIEIDLDNYTLEVFLNDTSAIIPLTITEFRLIAFLARTPRKVFTRLELLNACFSESDAMERTIDSHISKLRAKIDKSGLKNVPSSVRGVGYCLGLSQ
jgi:two-component system response regulator AdeR